MAVVAVVLLFLWGVNGLCAPVSRIDRCLPLRAVVVVLALDDAIVSEVAAQWLYGCIEVNLLISFVI